MNTNELLFAGQALLGGLVLGFLYFGGLWWTVKQIPKVKYPALLIMGGFAARSLGLLLGLYVVSGGQLVALGAAMIGFLVARVVMVRRQTRQAMEVGHAAKS